MVGFTCLTAEIETATTKTLQKVDKTNQTLGCTSVKKTKKTKQKQETSIVPSKRIIDGNLVISE